MTSQEDRDRPIIRAVIEARKETEKRMKTFNRAVDLRIDRLIQALDPRP